MSPLKMYFLLKMVIFHCYVSLPEGRFVKLKLWESNHSSKMGKSGSSGSGFTLMGFCGIWPFLPLVCWGRSCDFHGVILKPQVLHKISQEVSPGTLKQPCFFCKMVLISQLDDEPNHCHDKRVFHQTSIHLENYLFPVEMVRVSMIP